MPTNYFNNLKKDEDNDFAVGCIAAIILIAFSLFFPPFICRYAWNFIAVRRFALPSFNYWEWFWALWGIRMLIPTSSNWSGSKK